MVCAPQGRWAHSAGCRRRAHPPGLRRATGFGRGLRSPSLISGLDLGPSAHAFDDRHVRGPGTLATRRHPIAPAWPSCSRRRWPRHDLRRRTAPLGRSSRIRWLRELLPPSAIGMLLCGPCRHGHAPPRAAEHAARWGRDRRAATAPLKRTWAGHHDPTAPTRRPRCPLARASRVRRRTRSRRA